MRCAIVRVASTRGPGLVVGRYAVAAIRACGWVTNHDRRRLVLAFLFLDSRDGALVVAAVNWRWRRNFCRVFGHVWVQLPQFTGFYCRRCVAAKDGFLA